MIRKVFLALGLTLFSGSAAWAIPQTLNFQGFLKESGSPVTGGRDIEFRICATSDCSDVRFTDTDHKAASGHSVVVSTGIFTVSIGEFASGGIPLSVFDGSDRYVEVKVGTTTLLPRQKITSFANAFFAATAANLVPTATVQIASITASSATFTAAGPNQYSLMTSSGILVASGGVTAPLFSGNFVGDGSGLTGLSGTDNTKVAKAGDAMTGQLTLSGSTLTVTGNAFSVGGTTLAASGGKIGIGTASPATKLHLSSGALTIDGGGAGLNVAGPSSATYFYGDGAGLTGVTDSNRVARAGDSMTGQLTLAGSTLTVTGNAFSVGGATLTAGGGKVGVGTASPATKLHLSSGALTIDGSGAGLNVAGPSSATYFYGNGSGLTGISGQTQNSGYVYLTDEYMNSGAIMGPCLSGSTITLTTSGNPVELLFTFSQAHTTTGGGTRVQVLMDGAWIDDFATDESMAPMGRESGGSAVQLFPTHLHYRTATAPSAGEHKFCITFMRSANGNSYIACKKNGTFEGAKKCLFMVKELK